MTSDEYRTASPADKVATMLGTWEYRLTSSLAQTIGAKQVRPNAKSWVKGGNLLQLIRDRDDLRSSCEKARQSHTHQGGLEWHSLAAQALHAQREVRKEIHRRKKRQREETFLSIEREWSHPKLFYRRVQQMRSDGSGTAPGISAPVLRDPRTNTMEHDLAKRLDITRHHYATLGTDERREEIATDGTMPGAGSSEPNTPRHEEECMEQEVDPNPNTEYDRRFAARMEARVRQMAEESLAQAETALDRPFEAEEMSAALLRVRNGKAPGADNIHGEFLRQGGPQLEHSMLILFNEILRLEVWPERWCLGLICPIYKRAGDESDLDNYRPITLLSIVSKLFEILLNTRLMAWAETNRVLCDEQGGFRSKRGCADQLFILKEVWSSRREHGRQATYSAFLDVKSAYDRVWRTGLWYRLYECGVRGKLWRMIRAMYAHMVRVVIVDGQRTESFPVEVGVSQGSVLSPFLYSIFIDGLIRMLKAAGGVGVRLADGEPLVGLLYADDIVLLAPSPEVLQRMLTLTTRYARQWRFHFNGRKSQIVVQGSNQQVADAQAHGQWRLDGQTLSVVSEYKYLGMECGLPPRAAPHASFCTRVIQSTTQRAHDILLAGCEMNELDARCSSRLWNTLCRPILEYGAEVWQPNAGQRKQLEQTQGWFARRVLGCHQGTPAVFATSELGMRSLEHRREQYHLRYWYRLCSALPERLLHRIFRQRVIDVKQLPDEQSSTSYSLCRMLQQTLLKYDLASEWDQVLTDQLYLSDEWTSKVRKMVLLEEANTRQAIMTARSTLDCYSAALAPKVGQMAPYLRASRNREGAWIQCRLRSESLPLMQTLGRQCHPPRRDLHAVCRLCDSPPQTSPSATPADCVSAPALAPTHHQDLSHDHLPTTSAPGPAAVEGVTHFLAECQAPAMRQLRRQLCMHIREAVGQWRADQLEQQLRETNELRATATANPATVTVIASAAVTTSTTDGAAPHRPVRSTFIGKPAGAEMTARAIEAIVQRMEMRNSSDAPSLPRGEEKEEQSREAEQATRSWCELILGRCRDPTTNRPLDSSLLRLVQVRTQNFLLLSWRTRAALMGGVPTLVAGGHGGTVLMPYRRMKTIGLRQVRVRGSAFRT